MGTESLDQHVAGEYQGKTVAITGASGYIGSALVEGLLRTPARILRVSRCSLPPVTGTDIMVGDVRTNKCWREILAQADVVFHLAGNTSAYRAASEPADSLTSTVMPIVQLAAVAKMLRRRPRVVFASTATVYGLTEHLPVAETLEPRPITTYDLHKLFAEKQLEFASDHKVLEGVSLRLANVYGCSPGLSSAGDRGVLNKIAKLCSEGRELPLYGGAEYVRDYVNISDVVRAFLTAGVANRMVGQSFNVGSGIGVTVRQAFELVAERAALQTGRKVVLNAVPWPDGADPIERRNFVADISRLHKAAGWSPSVNLTDGIDQMMRVNK